MQFIQLEKFQQAVLELSPNHALEGQFVLTVRLIHRTHLTMPFTTADIQVEATLKI